jgi:hypothetical protein
VVSRVDQDVISLSIDRMPSPVRRVLEAHRIDQATLERIAGADRVIRGDELGLLYAEVRARNPRPAGANVDAAAEVYQALRRHLGVEVDAISGASPIRPGLRAEMRNGPRRPDLEEPAPPEIDHHQRAEQMAALPPATQGNLQSVRSYLDAISAREQGQRRPQGVTGDQWALTRALEIEGITRDDVERYLATGGLPEGKLERLERAAVRGGSWTATNSLTFLISARRSAMAAERQAIRSRMETLAPDDPMRVEIQSALRASESLDRDLGRGLQAIYRARTYAAGRNGQAAVERASALETQAQQARDRGDHAAADRLTAKAQQARDRAARIGQSEGDYRAAMRLGAAGDAYRLAARAQVETGSLRVGALRDTYGPIQDQLPPELGNDDGTNTNNRVRGAGLLLTQAGTVDGDGGRNHAFPDTTGPEARSPRSGRRPPSLRPTVG